MLDITLKIGKNRQVNLKQRRQNMKIMTGDELKRFRKLNDLTQGQIARILGLRKIQINNWESKHPDRQLPKWILERIAKSKQLDAFDSLYPEEQKLSLWERIIGIFKR